MRRQLNSLCAGKKVFVKYQAQWFFFNPKPPLAYALGGGTGSSPVATGVLAPRTKLQAAPN